MTNTVAVEPIPGGWHVRIRTGAHEEFYGPYRWRWVARLVAWFESDVH